MTNLVLTITPKLRKAVNKAARRLATDGSAEQWLGELLLTRLAEMQAAEPGAGETAFSERMEGVCLGDLIDVFRRTDHKPLPAVVLKTKLD